PRPSSSCALEGRTVPAFRLDPAVDHLGASSGSPRRFPADFGPPLFVDSLLCTMLHSQGEADPLPIQRFPQGNAKERREVGVAIHNSTGPTIDYDLDLSNWIGSDRSRRANDDKTMELQIAAGGLSRALYRSQGTADKESRLPR